MPDERTDAVLALVVVRGEVFIAEAVDLFDVAVLDELRTEDDDVEEEPPLTDEVERLTVERSELNRTPCVPVS